MEIIALQGLFMKYFEEGANDGDKLYYRNKIRRKWSSESAFTAFKVWIVKRNNLLMTEFGELLNWLF